MIGPVDNLQTRPEWQAQSTVKYTLQGYVRTDVPGYRLVQIGASLIQVASGTYRWVDLITQLNTQLVAAGFAGCDVSAGYGTEISTGTSDTLTFPDRLGWLLGYGTEAGASVPWTADPIAAPFVAPGGVALLGATWTEVILERERRAVLDRYRRSSGYVWGSARIWRLVLTMTRWALEALEAGWLRSGRVAVVPVGGAPVVYHPETAPGGYLDGYFVGVEKVKWLDPAQQRFAAVTVLMTTTVA